MEDAGEESLGGVSGRRDTLGEDRRDGRRLTLMSRSSSA